MLIEDLRQSAPSDIAHQARLLLVRHGRRAETCEGSGTHRLGDGGMTCAPELTQTVADVFGVATEDLAGESFASLLAL